MSFGGDIANFQKKTSVKMQKVIYKSAYDLFASIVFSTPVKKGVLRNNWFASIGTGSSETTDRAAPSGGVTVQRINEVLKTVDLNDIIYLSNNLVYALPIEFDGGGGREPGAMVRANTIRWDTIVSNNAKRYNK